MMKSSFVLFLIAVQISGFFFVGSNNNFSVLLPSEMSLVKVDTLSNDLINYIFSRMDDGDGIEYSFSISVINGIENNLLLTEKITDFEEKCNCEVIDSREINFNHFGGIEYKIKKKKEEYNFEGFVYFSKPINGKKIHTVGMGLEGKSDQLRLELESIMNTIVPNITADSPPAQHKK